MSATVPEAPTNLRDMTLADLHREVEHLTLAVVFEPLRTIPAVVGVTLRFGVAGHTLWDITIGAVDDNGLPRRYVWDAEDATLADEGRRGDGPWMSNGCFETPEEALADALTEYGPERGGPMAEEARAK